MKILLWRCWGWGSYPLPVATARHNLGFLAASDNKHQQAAAQFRQALDIYQATGADLLRSSNTRRHLADSLIVLGELESAREQLKLALETIPEQGWGSRGVEMLLSCAKLFIQSGARASAGEVLTFLRDDEAVSPSVKEQAADILAAGSLAPASPRYRALDEVMAAARQRLCDS